MQKKNPKNQPITHAEWKELVDAIGVFSGKVDKRLGSVEKNVVILNKRLGSLETGVSHLSAKVDTLKTKVDDLETEVKINTSAITALDKRVRYQDDMPERLEYVEGKTHTLERRVFRLEQK